ncbi:hypothetical protein, partial [Streptomyces fructofermentans]|uniref:hypothetical protein n=1 Tax=Streptomyces fructofermentans TaxID=152141 RepID=UPI00167B0377
MHLIEDLYLGWEQLPHTATCERPAWDIDVRHDEGAHPLSHRADLQHDCSTCDHGPTFPRVTVRVICRSCQTVHLITGEGLGRSCTTTEVLGYGQAPSQVSGVWLWPGQPSTPGSDPGSFLVTRDRVSRVTRASVAGLITGYWDSEGRTRWIAGADLDDDGTHRVHSLSFTHRAAD